MSRKGRLKRRLGSLPDEEAMRWMRRDLGSAGEQYDLCHGIAKKSLTDEPERTLAASILEVPLSERNSYYLKWRMCGHYEGVTVEPTRGLANEWLLKGYRIIPLHGGGKGHGKPTGPPLGPEFYGTHAIPTTENPQDPWEGYVPGHTVHPTTPPRSGVNAPAPQSPPQGIPPFGTQQQVEETGTGTVTAPDVAGTPPPPAREPEMWD